MWMWKLAWKNMWRNRTRTAITMAAIFFAVILSVMAESFKQGIFDHLVKNMVGYFTGYIQIHQNGYWEEQNLDNAMSADSLQLENLKSVPYVVAASPRLQSFALASGKDLTKACMVIGINPESESEVTRLHDRIERGIYFDSLENGALLGKGLAAQLKSDLGDTLVLIGQGYHGATAAGKFIIQGILGFGAPELNNRLLFLKMKAAQEFYGAEQLWTSAVIGLNDGKKLSQSLHQISALIPEAYKAISWEQMLPEVKQHIEADSNSMKYVQGILYLLICFGIFGTLLMMMIERKYEMGMLVAIGMKKSKLVLLMLMESVLTVFTGCVLGILFSIPLVHYFKEFPIRIGGEAAKAYERFGFEPIFPSSTDPMIYLQQGIYVLILGLILSLYPSYKILKMDPVQSMKR